MHRSCKNNSVKPDMSHWMISSEKLCEGNHMSRSDAAQTCSRLRQQKIENCKLTTGRFLGWASSHFWKRMQVRAVDQTAYPLQTSVASLATDWWMEPWPPAKLEVLHLYRWFTHTHTLSHTEAFTHRSFYTQTPLHRRFYTQALLQTDSLTHRLLYTQTLLHTDAFTYRPFYTQTHVGFKSKQKQGGGWTRFRRSKNA